MPTTKVFAAIWNNFTLTAGSLSTSGVQTIDDGYGAVLHLKITNGSTGPTLPADIQIEVSGDNSEWFDFGGRLIAALGNNAETSWGGIEIPMGVEFLRLVAGNNTVQNCTIDADISEVTAV